MTDTPTSPATARAIDERARLFAGSGEMKGRCRTFDWGSTPLGKVEQWPQSLRTIVSTILDSAFPNIVLWGPDLIQVYNDGYREVMGRKHPWGLGIPTRDCWPEAWAFNEPIYARVLGGETVAFDDVCIPLMRYGALEDFWFTLSYSPLRDETFGIAGVLVTLVETTSRVEAQKLEAEREQLLTQVQLERSRLSDVFEQAPMAVAVLTGPDHVYTIVSPAYARYVGNRTLLGRAFRDAIPEAVGASAAALMDSVYRTGVPVVRAEQVVPIDRDGDGVPEEYIFNVSYQPLRNRAGEVYAVTSLSTDVTEQVRARGIADAAAREVAHARRQLELVFSQAPTAIAVLDGPEHRFVLANPSYNRLVARELLVGQTVRDAFPELAGQGIFELLDGVFSTGKAFVASELEVFLRRAREKEPEQGFFNVTYQPLCTANDEVYGIGLVAVDVTESVLSRRRIEALLRESEVSLDELEESNSRLEEQHVELEITNNQLQENAAELEAQTSELETQAEELEEQRRIAHEANQAKGLFLATMSHELRTPLNAVGGYADLLLSGVRGDLTPVQRSDVERIRHSGKYLLGLINSILNFTKLDAGDIEFDVRPIAVRTLLHGVSDLVAPQIAAKSQHFTAVDCNAVTRVLADTDKAHQILLNLLTNALKFTGNGGAITLACVVREEWVEIQVTDTGRGIVPENVERIFDPFVQVDRHLTPSSQQGVGLGLAISRDLALGMGGHLTVTSVPGKGSTFTLALRRDLAALSS
ncbi:hypothetical protein BH11GEM1_BH11GEM1_35440 [soil metagenome]